MQSSKPKPDQFTAKILHWFEQHGRKDLPWQQDTSAYRVWVSEIMLQQTQVTTVIPYYQQFMQAFPDIQQLADASIDEVLHLWTGLGYYARARNLHRSAGIICQQYNGEFPQEFDQVLSLPGIGRSTAGAILAISQGQQYAILDGNVKRVLSRFACVAGWPGEKQVENTLWQLAEYYTPEKSIEQYTQAIMDLGATLCTRSKPRCPQCPVKSACAAFKAGNIDHYPGRKPKKTMPVKQKLFVMLIGEDGKVMLEQRPPTGIWGGLWSSPECDQGTDIEKWCGEHLNFHIDNVQTWPTQRHTFSHYHLDYTPVLATVSATMSARTMPAIMAPGARVWYNTQLFKKSVTEPAETPVELLARPLGLATPVKRLLGQLAQHSY